MFPINGTPMIGWQIQRIQQAKSINKLIVATSDSSTDDGLVSYIDSIGVEVFRGALEDVYSRFVGTLDLFEADAFLRLTADCPLMMPKLIDEMVEDFWNRGVDYMSNTLIPTYPDGLDIEVISTAAFLRLASIELSDLEREHVTLGIYQRPNEFALANFENDRDLSFERWTVDYVADLDFASRIFEEFKGNETGFGFQEVLEFLKVNPDTRNRVSGTMRNVAINHATERVSKDAD